MEEERLLQLRHQVVLDMVFGLHGERQWALRGIAREFGVSEERIRSILRKSLRILNRVAVQRATGQPLPTEMVVDSWQYEPLVLAIREISAGSPGTLGDIPITKLRERIKPHLQTLRRSEERAVSEHSEDGPEFCPFPTFEYDVALSFASSERHLAKYVATILRQEGFRVFYDAFYARHLWGRELPVEFDEIYRKKSRYCVIFVSRNYVNRMWTSLERRSAVARALQERGSEYILPVEVEAAELPGIPPTLGHLSLREFNIEQITRMLREKLEESYRSRQAVLSLGNSVESPTADDLV